MYDGQGLSRCLLAAPRSPWLPWCTVLDQWYLPHGLQISARRAAPIAEHRGWLRQHVVDALCHSVVVVTEAAEHGGGAVPGCDQKRAEGEACMCGRSCGVPIHDSGTLCGSDGVMNMNGSKYLFS